MRDFRLVQVRASALSRAALRRSRCHRTVRTPCGAVRERSRCSRAAQAHRGNAWEHRERWAPTQRREMAGRSFVVESFQLSLV